MMLFTPNLGYNVHQEIIISKRAVALPFREKMLELNEKEEATWSPLSV
jgi:hypothetical protein